MTRKAIERRTFWPIAIVVTGAFGVMLWFLLRALASYLHVGGQV